MHYVYILISEKDHKLYVGCSKDPEHRLALHNDGQVPSTKNRRPFALLHVETYEKKDEAFQRERFLKSLWAGRFKRKLVQQYLEKKGES